MSLQKSRDKIQLSQSKIRNRLLYKRFKAMNLPKPFSYALIGDVSLEAEIESGFPINRRDPIFGRTVLHHAVSKGHLNCVRIILEKGFRRLRIDKGTLLVFFISDFWGGF